MSSEVELWFASVPAISAIAEALERFGLLTELGSGELRLVEGDEDPREGVPFVLVEEGEPPAAVTALQPDARAMLRASAVLTGARGFWLGRVAAHLQARLGGVVYVPANDEAYADAHAFEHSWPADHVNH